MKKKIKRKPKILTIGRAELVDGRWVIEGWVFKIRRRHGEGYSPEELAGIARNGRIDCE